MTSSSKSPGPSNPKLNDCQKRAYAALSGSGNVFLTGGAGSGKSFLIRHYLRQENPSYPILASTGAAAILVGGRTFHSFFGLGIMEGGVETTVEKASKNRRLTERLRKCSGVIIDEISMIPGAAFRAAEKIARGARGKSEPWGGLRVIAVGDFSQLPPVSPFRQSEKDWAFLDAAWERSGFSPAVLRTIVRTRDSEFLAVLERIRKGVVDPFVSGFLNHYTRKPSGKFSGTRLFPHRSTTEEFNLKELESLPGEAVVYETVYSGKKQSVEDLKKHAPIPERISLKKGALVMIRQNDPEGRWVNGSLGHVTSLESDEIGIELLSGRGVELEQTTFHILDSDGERAAAATNFPVMLAYATTIHKAQGTTLDEMNVDLRNLWEPGHAYVALSRVRKPSGLYIQAWTPRSIFVDPAVRALHEEIGLDGDSSGLSQGGEEDTEIDEFNF